VTFLCSSSLTRNRALSLSHTHTFLRDDDFCRLAEGVCDAFVEQSYGHPACARCVMMLLHSGLAPKCRVAVLGKLADSRVLHLFPTAASLADATLISLLEPVERDVAVLRGWVELACRSTAGFTPDAAPLCCAVGIHHLRHHIFGPFEETTASSTQSGSLSFGRNQLLRKLGRGANAAVFARICSVDEGPPEERARVAHFADAVTSASTK